MQPVRMIQLVAHNNYIEVYLRLGKSLLYQEMTKMENHGESNGTKSIYVIFTTHKVTCLLVTLNSLRISEAEDANI